MEVERMMERLLEKLDADKKATKNTGRPTKPRQRLILRPMEEN
jgi:hypothetical protein